MPSIRRSTTINRYDSFNERHGKLGLSQDKPIHRAAVHRDNGSNLEGRGRANAGQVNGHATPPGMRRSKTINRPVQGPSLAEKKAREDAAFHAQNKENLLGGASHKMHSADLNTQKADQFAAEANMAGRARRDAESEAWRAGHTKAMASQRADEVEGQIGRAERAAKRFDREAHLSWDPADKAYFRQRANDAWDDVDALDARLKKLDLKADQAGRAEQRALARANRAGNAEAGAAQALQNAERKERQYVAEAQHLSSQAKLAEREARAAHATASSIQKTQKPGKYSNLAQMQPQYLGEQNGTHWGTKVKYLDSSERESYKLTFDKGRAYTADGRLFDTRNGGDHGGRQITGRYIYAMDNQGGFYAHGKPAVGQFHHSSFLAGRDVASAGTIEARDGKLYGIDRSSGHYRPTQEQLNQAVSEIRDQGMNMGRLNVSNGF